MGCNGDLLYKYVVKSKVPLDFVDVNGNYEIRKKEEVLHQSRRESVPRTRSPRRSSPSPPRRTRNVTPPPSNKLVNDDSSFVSRIFNVWVPGSSVNNGYTDLASDNSYLWDDV